MSKPTISKGHTWVNNAKVTPSLLNKMVDEATLNFTQSNVLAGRSTSGAGEAEEIPCTAAGRSLLAAADQQAQQALLGAGEQRGYVNTQVDKTNDTFADVPGLAATVVAGTTYSFEAVLYISVPSSPVVSASKWRVNGTSSISSIGGGWSATGQGGGYNSGFFTAFPGGGGTSPYVSGPVWITGTFTVSIGGSFAVQFAQGSASGGTSSVLVGSHLRVWSY